MTRGRGCRGFSVVEILIASIILGLLVTALFGLFRTGIVSMRKVDNQTELIRELQILSLKITDEASASSFKSLCLSGNHEAVSFLSAVDKNGVFRTDEFGRPEWQEFILYYYQQEDSTIRRTTVPFVTGSPIEARTLEQYSGKSIDFYLGQGTPTILAHRVSGCRWDANPPAVIEFEFKVEKQRYQQKDMEQKRLFSAITMRN